MLPLVIEARRQGHRIADLPVITRLGVGAGILQKMRGGRTGEVVAQRLLVAVVDHPHFEISPAEPEIGEQRLLRTVGPGHRIGIAVHIRVGVGAAVGPARVDRQAGL